MPIHTDPETGETIVDFIGTDLITGLCGNEAGEVESIGIAAVETPGEPGQPVPDDLEVQPQLYLRFHSRAALESFFRVLEAYRDERFPG